MTKPKKKLKSKSVAKKATAKKARPQKQSAAKKKSVEPLVPIRQLFNTKWTFAISFAVLLTITGIIFGSYLSGKNIYIFEDIGSDTITLFYPKKAHNQWRNKGYDGKVKWSFFEAMGRNAFSAGIPSPIGLANRIHRPFVKGSAQKIPWEQATKVLLSGIAFFFLARLWGVRPLATILGSLAFAFCGYMMVGSSWYGHTTTIFNMVLIILGVELLLSKNQWWLLPVALAYFISPMMYFLFEFLLIYVIVRTFHKYDFNLKKTLLSGINLVAFGFLFFLLAAQKLGPKYFNFANSPRVTGNVSYTDKLSDTAMFARNGAEHDGTAIMRLFNNDLLGPGLNYEGWRNYLEAPLFYCGLLILLLVPQLFTFVDRKRKIMYGLLVGFWLWLTIFPFFRFAFYKFVGNYYKAALSLFIPFTLIFLGVMAFDHILKGKKVNLIVLGGSLAVFLLLLFLPNSAVAEHVDSSRQILSAGLLVTYAGLLAATRFIKNPIWIVIAMVAIFAGEMAYNGHYTNTKRQYITKEDWNSRTRHNDYSVEAMAYVREQNKDPFYRVEKSFGSVKSGYNDGMVQGFFGTRSYLSNNNKYHVRFMDETGVIDGSKEYNTRWLIGTSYTPILQPLLSVKYLLSTQATFQHVDYDLYQFKEKFNDVEVNESKYFIPMGIQYNTYIPYSEWSKLGVGQKRRSLYQAVVVEDADVGKYDFMTKLDVSKIGGKPKMMSNMKSLGEKAMTTEYFNQDVFLGKVNMEKEGILFFSIPYTQGWQAKVDDVKVPMDLMQLGFMGFKVPAGEHLIEVEYIPPFYTAGRWAYYIGLLIFIGLVAITKGKIPENTWLSKKLA